MSRSRRKSPITGNTKAKSEKRDKRIANRRLRRRNAQRIAGMVDNHELLDIRDVSDPYWFRKDGKQWIGDLKDHQDPEMRAHYEQLMRK